MSKIFDENFKYTTTAADIDHEISVRLRPIFKKYVDLGYSPRELGHVAQSAVNLLELESILELDSKRYKEKKRIEKDKL